jgi:FkbM family methyltransferase
MLKSVRVSQPFNRLATATLHALLAGTGRRSEWIIKHLHRAGAVRALLPNGRTLSLWSRGDDWVSNQIYWRGWDGYEPETTRLFYRLAERANVTIDIGAYVGYFTLLAAHANPAGRVIAFEPLTPVADRLRRNVRLNGLANVECVAGAVGDRDGEADFYHLPDGLPTSSSLSAEFMRQATGNHSRVVVNRLDRFVEEHGIARVDLLKIDTESTEPQVLAGAAAVLKRDRPHIICEVLAARAGGPALEAILRPLGYRFFLLTPDGPELRPTIAGHPAWLNYLFTTLTVDELPRSPAGANGTATQ